MVGWVFLDVDTGPLILKKGQRRGNRVEFMCPSRSWTSSFPSPIDSGSSMGKRWKKRSSVTGSSSHEVHSSSLPFFLNLPQTLTSEFLLTWKLLVFQYLRRTQTGPGQTGVGKGADDTWPRPWSRDVRHEGAQSMKTNTPVSVRVHSLTFCSPSFY